MYALRWIFALLMPAVGLVITALAAILLTEALDLVCPPELVVSGLCTASWYPASQQAAFAVASFLGAVVFVWLPAVTAPNFKPVVAWVAFAAGFAYGCLFLWEVGPSVLPSLGAAVAGGVLAALMKRQNAV